ncbi:MAG: hypothetical protein WCS01_04910 [bacterium]|jgi:hypothetical protein
MTKNVLIALVLIAISTIILIFSRDSVTVSFVFTEIKAMASIVYLCFIALGVVIGVLLK